MNLIEKSILKNMYESRYLNQRALAEDTDYALGTINQSLKNLTVEGYVDAAFKVTGKGKTVLQQNSPRRAVILAAGYGMRMVPINTETPKGLLEVYGEPLVERIIKQLHEVGIKEIYIVVGFMKEQYEYLIDEYNVKLVVSTEYSTKNNLFSLNRVKEYLENCYVIPCDIWCRNNPFSKYEIYSWYMITELADDSSMVRMNRKMELVKPSKGLSGNKMIGICYLTKEDAQKVKKQLNMCCHTSLYDDAFWEETLFENNKMIVAGKLCSSNNVVEINTYEQLRDLDNTSNHLKTDAIEIICQALHEKEGAIENIKVLKKGMTNRSFLFECDGNKYIMRIPGEGTEQLINRKQEAAVYEVIKDKNVCDDIVYINPENGYKITRYLNNARVCDPFNEEDICKCMAKLKDFHSLNLKVNHAFDIFGQIDFYESLWNGQPSVYRDYKKTKENVMKLKSFIESERKEFCLTHIDAVPDNFLFVGDDIRLIDWEYAGMQDPDVDIAMFCIYSLYNKVQVDHLIDIYFGGYCDRKTRIKIYCYIACCGLLWSNWCEYKRNLGIEFGEYSLRQYRYAKEYYKLVAEEIHLGE